MKKSLFAGATLTALFSGHALANEIGRAHV